MVGRRCVIHSSTGPLPNVILVDASNRPHHRRSRLAATGVRAMRFLGVLLLWAIVLVLCWPVALVLLVLWPILWLLSIPFRIVGALMDAIVALVTALLMLPARLLGHRPAT